MKKRTFWLLVSGRWFLIGLLFVVVILLVINNLKINGLVSYENLEGKKGTGITGNVIVWDKIKEFFGFGGEAYLQAPTINAVINASRTSCVAPCAVFFDAIGDLSWDQIEEGESEWVLKLKGY